jgi:hypothetical protein
MKSMFEFLSLQLIRNKNVTTSAICKEFLLVYGPKGQGTIIIRGVPGSSSSIVTG